VALQFSKAPGCVAAVIQGARNSQQAMENAKSMSVEIPVEFWKTLKTEKLIAENAPTPGQPDLDVILTSQSAMRPSY
jgi:D-threo-aldose 1-dehydrogenase